jgi:hypothetical protein
VTQPEDVPAQLDVESLRQKKKILVYESRARRSKALLEENLADSSDLVEPDVSGTLGVRKLKKAEAQPSRRSPRVNPSPGTGVDGKRHSPRVKVSLKASISPCNVFSVLLSPYFSYC